MVPGISHGTPFAQQVKRFQLLNIGKWDYLRGVVYPQTAKSSFASGEDSEEMKRHDISEWHQEWDIRVCSVNMVCLSLPLIGCYCRSLQRHIPLH